MTTPIEIHIRQLPHGLWHAIQYTGTAKLPTTVASMSKTANGVLESVKARQSAGMIPADAIITIHDRF